MSWLPSIPSEARFALGVRSTALARGAGLSVSRGVLVLASLAPDFFALCAALLVARAAGDGPRGTVGRVFGEALACLLVFALTAKDLGLYRLRAQLAPRTVVFKIGVAGFFSATAVAFLRFLLETDSRTSGADGLSFVVLAPLFVIGERLAWGRFARRAAARGWVRGKRVVLIGERSELERLALREFSHVGLQVVGSFRLALHERSHELSDADRDAVLRALQHAREAAADEFALVLPWARERALVELSALLRASPLPARLYADCMMSAALSRDAEDRFSPGHSIELRRAPLNGLERLLKRLFDVAFAAAALVALSPLLLVTAALVRLGSAGPAIFRQRRRGFGQRDFTIYKFRTLSVMEDGPEIRQVRRGDSRLTRLGAWLRRSSFDELPQLWNVLRGDMSLVGPRPHAIAHDDAYGRQIEDYAFRCHVKPGLTGLAQVRGCRGQTRTLEQMRRRVEHDLWYIDHWSPGLDLKIILLTFRALLRDEAY